MFYLLDMNKQLAVLYAAEEVSEVIQEYRKAASAYRADKDASGKLLTESKIHDIVQTKAYARMRKILDDAADAKGMWIR